MASADHISPTDLKRRIEAGEHLQIFDVRTPSEFASGHVPGAANLPMDEVEARLDDLSTDRPAVLVCQSGQRAAMTCELIGASHPNVLVLEGGTDAWVQAGLPTVRSTKTRWSLDRQVRLGAGVLVLTGLILAKYAHPGWIFLTGFVGAGLTFSGLTNFCGMALLLSRMPWNQPKRLSSGTAASSSP
ncbi:MAG: Inner membrane protein YgaP [Fimbriimonadales bacterium]|nr:Inner membrane protein YgaP [Fimbriimonadales bacterium]